MFVGLKKKKKKKNGFIYEENHKFSADNKTSGSALYERLEDNESTSCCGFTRKRARLGMREFL